MCLFPTKMSGSGAQVERPLPKTSTRARVGLEQPAATPARLAEPLVRVQQEARERAVLVVIASVRLPTIQLHIHLVPGIKVQHHAIAGVVVVLVCVLRDGAGPDLGTSRESGVDRGTSARALPSPHPEHPLAGLGPAAPRPTLLARSFSNFPFRPRPSFLTLGEHHGKKQSGASGTGTSGEVKAPGAS